MKKIVVKKAKLGSLSAKDASNKRVPSASKGSSWYDVQVDTLAGAKGTAKLTKDKQLGATKMSRRGSNIKKAMGGMSLPSVIANKIKEREAEKYKDGGVAKAKGGKWIQKAISKPGALRQSLGVKKGEKIPAGKLAAAAKKPGKMGQRARLAQTLGKMRKK